MKESLHIYIYVSSDSDLEFNLDVVNHPLEDPSDLFWPEKYQKEAHLG